MSFETEFVHYILNVLLNYINVYIQLLYEGVYPSAKGRKEFQMSAKEKRELLIRQKNEIIQQSGNRLTALKQKVLFYLISQVDDRRDETSKIYTVSISEMCDVCGLNHQEYYSIVKSIFKQLATPLGYIRNEQQKDRLFAWLSSEDVEIDNSRNTATFRFHKQVAPYLYELKERYTEFQLINGLSLKSKYSMSLYQLLKSYERVESHKAIFEVERLKRLLGVNYLVENDRGKQEWIDIYPRFFDFEKRALKPSVNEINNVCDINCHYEIERIKRKPHKIIFDVRAKNPFEDPEGVRRMKEEQNRRLNPDDTKK